MRSQRDQGNEDDDTVNVRDLVARKGPLPLVDAINYAFQVAEDLASQPDVVHGEIKPSNVLVMSDGQAKLLDTGVPSPNHVTEHMFADHFGSDAFDYISPELAKDPRENSVRGDLYSLGCTFYFMLTGVPPFPDGTILQKLLSHNHEPPPDPGDVRTELPKEVSAIAMKLMAKLPNQRYQTPLALMEDLAFLAKRTGLSLSCPVANVRDKPSENPYEPPAETSEAFMTERRSGRLPWWLRPGGTPSVLVALPFFILLMVAIVFGLLVPMLQWLWR